MTDWDLPRDPLAALRGGDSGPFEGFVRSHARTLFAFFRRQGAGLHKAEDLTQEVFLKLHRKAPQYRPDERFQAFVFRVARNVWIDDRRRAGARVAPGRLEGPEGSDRERIVGGLSEERDPVELVALVEEGQRLRRALEELPETHRAVFELGAIQELPYADVASILEIPVGTVKSRMYHALRKLREALEPDGARKEEEGVA